MCVVVCVCSVQCAVWLGLVWLVLVLDSSGYLLLLLSSMVECIDSLSVHSRCFNLIHGVEFWGGFEGDSRV